ncbi:MFS transporter [Pseudoclavibacter sp. VKM Ac-2867]|uniref:MFS transporter n=1 Tax=Pseudoclavibacter sp. VKM Ac-2867 TaxID=2783829 RepID=UPI00188B7D8F|nr:MFS transporter [Pseudoclavibacter sp. VKM Ac-2867]MBF4457854.1 MFS transporter [Pseudoclavibacter sp. VKM Ac-2867]
MTNIRPRERALAAFAAIAFGFVIAGANSINPLLPMLRAEVPLSPLGVSLTFVVYVSAAVATLLVVGFTRLRVTPGAAVVAALLIAALANLLLASSSEVQLLVGRAATGVAVGLATGGAAGLVVGALRGRGRGLAATGNLVGAVVGTAIAQGVAALETVAGAMSMYFAGAATALVLALVLALLLPRGVPRAARKGGAGAPASRRLTRADVRTISRAAVVWTGLSSGVVYAPTVFSDASMPIAQFAGSVTMLVAAAIAQLASVPLGRLLPAASGHLAFAVGCALAVTSVLISNNPLALLAMALLGAGGAVAYRTSLVHLTRGAAPSQQSSLASKFAVATYAASASTVLVIGVLGGVMRTEVVLAVFATLLSVAAVCMHLGAPRFRDLADGPTGNGAR